jgi:hypothetical protein
MLNPDLYRAGRNIRFGAIARRSLEHGPNLHNRVAWIMSKQSDEIMI